MKFFVVPLCVALVVAVPTNRLQTTSEQFASWKIEHGKVYHSDAEYERRLHIFSENLKVIEKHNSEGHSWTMGVNQFADMTPKEFASLQTLFPSKIGTPESPAHNRFVPSGSSIPDAVDWRTEGLVTDVKNQGQCGSCWAFSTVASLEGQVAKKTGNLVSFSEQDLVDCVKGVDDCCDGCNGGLMDSAFQYMIQSQQGKDDTEDSYPYKGVDGTCSFQASSVGAAPITNFTDIEKGNEDALKEAVATVGPISVAVDANIFWQFYSGGIFDPFWCSGDTLNHGVAVVGYGDGYLIIRNSWAASWGEQGYMRMKSGSNICGVANSASYPNV